MRATQQPDLTLCKEEVHKPNNVAAIICSVDVIGGDRAVSRGLFGSGNADPGSIFYRLVELG